MRQGRTCTHSMGTPEIFPLKLCAPEHQQWGHPSTGAPTQVSGRRRKADGEGGNVGDTGLLSLNGLD